MQPECPRGRWKVQTTAGRHPLGGPPHRRRTRVHPSRTRVLFHSRGYDRGTGLPGRFRGNMRAPRSPRRAPARHRGSEGDLDVAPRLALARPRRRRRSRRDRARAGRWRRHEDRAAPARAGAPHRERVPVPGRLDRSRRPHADDPLRPDGPRRERDDLGHLDGRAHEPRRPASRSRSTSRNSRRSSTTATGR